MKRTGKLAWTTVSISAESRRLLEQHAAYGLSSAVPRADGRYDVQLDNEVLTLYADVADGVSALGRPRTASVVRETTMISKATCSERWERCRV